MATRVVTEAMVATTAPRTTVVATMVGRTATRVATTTMGATTTTVAMEATAVATTDPVAEATVALVVATMGDANMIPADSPFMRTGTGISPTTPDAMQFPIARLANTGRPGHDLRTGIGQRLQQHYDNWTKVTRDQWVLHTIRNGYTWHFTRPPPLTTVPPPPCHPSPGKEKAMDDMLEALLAQGAIEELVEPETPGFYSRWFLVPKKDPNKWRAILDLSTLNEFVEKESLKMETAEVVRGHLQQGEWMTSLDITDAYHHIPIKPTFRKYLRFRYKNRICQYCCLPMGLTTACHTFTRIIRVIKAYFSMQGIQLHQYLDDWLLHANNEADMYRLTQMMVELTEGLGFIINYKKSALKPAQRSIFLAYDFNLSEGLVHPTQERWNKIVAAATRFQAQESAPAGQWQSLLGLLTATEKVVHFGMLHLRDIQRGLLNQWSPWRDQQTDILLISDPVRQALRWWTDPANVLPGVPLHAPQPDAHIFTDACLEGWGGHWEDMDVAATWSPEELMGADKQPRHINELELLAMWRTLQALLPLIDGRTILLATDNTTALAYINKQGGTRSGTMMDLTKSFFQWLNSTQITLRCRHIPGKLNIRADNLSRGRSPQATEWSLHPEILKTLWNCWGTPMIDMFATADNKKLPLYVSPILDPQALAVDALSMNWTGLDLYMFPPTAILNKVLNKLRTEECSAILIAPAWPKQPWYPALLELLIDEPIQLPTWPKLLKQPRSSVFHEAPEMMRLHAWRLSCKPTSQKDFLTRLQGAWQEHKSPQASQYMMENGSASLIGVKGGMSIRSRLM